MCYDTSKEVFQITLKKLDEIAEIYNGVRERRYENDNTESQKIFQLERPSSQLSVSRMELSTNINKKFYSKKGDILVNLSFPHDIFLITEENVLIPSKFAVIRLNDGYDSNYLYQIMNSNKRIFSRLSKGSVLSFLKISEFKSIKLDLPDFEEQKRVGEILRLVDKKIEKQREIIKNEVNFKNSILGEVNVKL